MKNQLRPTSLNLHQKSRILEIGYPNGETHQLSCEFLRIHSPSAEVVGHGPGQEILQVGKRNVEIVAIEPVGNYAVQLVFSDGHDTGIYSWELLYRVGSNQDELWTKYLQRMEEAGASRDA